MAIDNEAILQAIDLAKDNAYGADNTSLSNRRTKAIEYYLGLNTNPAPEGRSQVVDRSVYETIQVMLPSLVRIFADSNDDVCKAIPIGPDDEQGAEQTTAVLKHYVCEKNNWEQISADWIHDALLLANSYCMAYWDESKRLIREVYEGQSDDQVALLMQDSNVTILQHSQTVDKQATQEAQEAYQAQIAQFQQLAQAAQAQAQQTGNPPQIPPPPQPPQPVILHDLVIERAENDGKVCIKVLPPEHCLISADTPDWTLAECPYFEFRQQKTIADLRQMGFDVPEDVSDEEDPLKPEDSARNRFGENNFADENKGVMRLVWARMIWIRADAEGDEESRLYYVVAVGRTILFAEPCGRIPVSSMTCQPLPHRHIGMSVAETVLDIQDIKQAVKRGALDNLYLANNGRHVISDKVNLADMLDSRPGGVVRLEPGALPMEGHVTPLVHPFAFDSIVGSLEYFDQERQNRTGASRYFSGTDAGAINKTASGTIALQNMASMRIEHIARMMAPAVEALFSCVWEIISKHANKALILKLKGKWVAVDPQAWRTKRDIRISVGVGAGNKDMMMQQLQGVLASQMQIGVPLGLVQRDNIQATNVEILKLAGFANPEKFWPDPANLPPPQPQKSPEQVLAEAEAQKTQYQAQQDAMKTQAEHQLEKEKLIAAAIENDKDRQLKLDLGRMSEATKLSIAELQVNAQQSQTQASQAFEAQKLGVQMSREDQIKAQEQQQVEQKDKSMQELLGNLLQALQVLSQGVQGLQDHVSRPRIAVRDPKTGKPMYGRPATDAEIAAMNGTLQ